MIKKKAFWFAAIMVALLAFGLVACNPAKERYTVTFTGEEISIDSQSVEDGKRAQKPEDPVREGGYIFGGWYLGDTPYTFTEPVKGDLTLVAKWNVEMKGEGTALSPYIIENIATLKESVQKMNSDSAYLSAWYKMTADVTLTDEWIPVATAANPFKGTFDGNGYKISGIIVASVTKDAPGAGLFGVVEDAKITGLTLENVSIKVSQPGQSLGEAMWNASAGAIAGTAVNSEISYVSVSGRVEFSSSSVAASSVGGIVGKLDGGEIKYVSAAAAVTADHSKASAGGIAGEIVKGYVMDSYSTGAVDGRNAVGGAAGTVSKGGVVFNCFSTGSVTLSGAGYAGGVVGLGNPGAAVQNCFSKGSITGETLGAVYAGAVSGDMQTDAMHPAENLINVYRTAGQTVTGTYVSEGEPQLGDFDSLGFSSADWDISGSLPVLKPEAGKPERGSVTVADGGTLRLTFDFGHKLKLSELPANPSVASGKVFGGWYFGLSAVYEGMPLTADLTVAPAAVDNIFAGKWLRQDTYFTVSDSVAYFDGVTEKTYQINGALSVAGEKLATLLLKDSGGGEFALYHEEDGLTLYNADLESAIGNFIPDIDFAFGAWGYFVETMPGEYAALESVIFTSEFDAAATSWTASYSNDLFMDVYTVRSRFDGIEKSVWFEDTNRKITRTFVESRTGLKMTDQDGKDTEFIADVEFYDGEYSDGTNAYMFDSAENYICIGDAEGTYEVTSGYLTADIGGTVYRIYPSEHTLRVVPDTGAAFYIAKAEMGDLNMYEGTWYENSHTLVVETDSNVGTFNGQACEIFGAVDYNGFYFYFTSGNNRYTFSVDAESFGAAIRLSSGSETWFLVDVTNIMPIFTGEFKTVKDGVVKSFAISAEDYRNLEYVGFLGMPGYNMESPDGNKVYLLNVNYGVYLKMLFDSKDQYIDYETYLMAEDFAAYAGEFTDGTNNAVITEESGRLLLNYNGIDIPLSLEFSLNTEFLFFRGVVGTRVYEVSFVADFGNTLRVFSCIPNEEDKPTQITDSSFVYKEHFEKLDGEFIYNKNAEDKITFENGKLTVPYVIPDENNPGQEITVRREKGYLVHYSGWGSTTVVIGFPKNADDEYEDLTDADFEGPESPLLYANAESGYWAVGTKNYVQKEYSPYAAKMYISGNDYFTISDSLKVTYNNLMVEPEFSAVAGGVNVTFSITEAGVSTGYTISLTPEAVTLTPAGGAAQSFTPQDLFDTKLLRGYYASGDWTFGMFDYKKNVPNQSVEIITISKGQKWIRIAVSKTHFVIKDGNPALFIEGVPLNDPDIYFKGYEASDYENWGTDDFYVWLDGDNIMLQFNQETAVALAKTDFSSLYGTYTGTDSKGVLHSFVLDENGWYSEDFGNYGKWRSRPVLTRRAGLP